MLVYKQSDETKKGAPVNITIPNNVASSISFDKASYKVRDIAHFDVTLINTGKIDLNNLFLRITAPDFSYENRQMMNLPQGASLSMQYVMPIPDSALSGQHAITIAQSLSAGNAVVQSANLTIPNSALSVTYSGPATISAGNTLNIVIENTGGVDTTYISEKLQVGDDRGIIIYQASFSGTILAGEKKSLADIQIPFQTAKGPVILSIRLKDTKTGKQISFNKVFDISGLDAGLSSRSDKEAYLTTENITAISMIENRALNIEDGALNIKVSNYQTADSVFTHFLPKTGWGSFFYPSGVAIAPDGAVYVADSGNNRIQKLDNSGNFVAIWGSYGSGNGQFSSPQGIAIAPDGSVYVTDISSSNIQKFDGSGNFIAKWGSVGDGDGQFYMPYGVAVAPDGSVYVVDASSLVQRFDGNGNFITKWGSYGDGDGQFSAPQGITVAPDGSVYVADTHNNRIQKFDGNGVFIAKWGSKGSGSGQFDYPTDIAAAPDGSVYVADNFNHRIQKFDSNGIIIAKWGSYGSGNGQFNYPAGIAIAPDGSVYVVDSSYSNSRIQKFDSKGVYITKWGSYGSGDGQFYYPYDIAVAPDGSLYVADTSNRRIQKFDGKGNFIRKWGSYGSGNGQFNNPRNIAVASDSSVYVSDNYNHRIQKFDSNGVFIAKWGSYGSGNGQFNYPAGIAVAPDGSLYVADTSNRRIQKFDGNGNFITKWGSYGSGIGEFSSPQDIAVAHDGSIYVADSGNNRIQKFDSNGGFITKWGSYGYRYDDGKFRFPSGIAVSLDGSVYVADTDFDRIQKFDSNGNYITQWNGFYNPEGISIAPDGFVYVADTYDHQIQRLFVSSDGTEALFETTIPVTHSANTTLDYTTSVGTLNTTGKLYLVATLKNSLGQTIAKSEYPFYIVSGNTVLLFNTDKKIYTPGETVTITGEVKNLASVSLDNAVINIASGASILLNRTITTIPAGGTYPFTLTTAAGIEGTASLTGKVSQHNSALVEIADQFEVAKPTATVTVSAPDVIGKSAFDLNLEMKNTGKVGVSVQLTAFGSEGSTIDNQQLTIPAGETKLLQYVQQIMANTEYAFTIVGDVEQTVTKTVVYGEAATIQLGDGNADLGVKAAGKIGIPVTITNTGQLDETVAARFKLQDASNNIIQDVTRTYYLPMSGSVTDTLYFDLTKGSYQLSAISNQPAAGASAHFEMREENKAAMILSSGTQSSGLIPVTVNITNLGYNSLNGSLQLSVISSQGTVVWNASQNVSELANGNSQLSTYNINPSALTSGAYTLRAELLDSSNQQIAVSDQPLTISGSMFQITQLPSYRTFTAGQEAEFAFRIKNTGSQEGAIEFKFKAYDMIDASRREWLNPGEEKEVNFAFMLPEDIETKDYFAEYTLTPALSPSGEGVIKGQVKYKVAGINLNVTSALDRQNYSAGDTVHLTLSIQSPTPNPQSLFARVNYAGFESRQEFTLNGSATLTFDIPLSHITGEKLFYGIYHESGRSIHLNSLYIHKAGDAITITTNKQVYNPGETVSIAISSQQSALSGTMTLSAPGYSETFAFSGTASKSFALPLTMTAGTYSISAQLSAVSGETFSESRSFDVAGIQVKVLECKNDKGKYAASDTISTELTVSSNNTMPAVLKTWIVDPEGKYSAAGETGINLNAIDNVLVSLNSALLTTVSGIHRLVYGIYSGDLLLVSGSEAFDVGDAVLLGLKTDKTDYATNTESVKATATLYGSVSANVELQLDGATVKNETTLLNGFSALEMDMGSVTPGPHVLKGILTAGGLKSTKETSFVYGSNLPDLTAAISYQQSAISNDNTVEITATAANQGRTASATTTIALYDGDSLIETKQVNALNSGESQELVFVLNVLGKTGTRILKAVVDPDNTVVEFNEANNIATMNIVIPDLTLMTGTDKDIYKINQNVQISSTIRNLSSEKTFSSLTLATTAKDSSGNEVYTNTVVLPDILPLGTKTDSAFWNTTGLNAEGLYTISQKLLTDSQLFAQSTKTVTLRKIADFAMSIDSDYKSIRQGEKAIYTAHLEPLDGWSTGITLNLQGLPAGTSASFNPANLVPPGEALTVVITTDATAAGKYTLNLVAEGLDEGQLATHALPLTLDVAGFALETMPASITLKQLETAVVELNLTAVNGYTGEVMLSIGGVPHGVRASISSPSVQTPGNTQLTILTSKYVKPGIYTLTVTGDDGIVKHRQNITLNLLANPDIAAGIITAQGPGLKNQALVRVFSADLQSVLDLTAFSTKYGANVTSADIDGDGYDEIIVAEGPDPKNPATLRAFRRNGALIAEYTAFDTKYGLTLSSGDIDGDWKDELIVGMGPDPKNPAILKVFKYQGNGFVELMSHTAYAGLKYGLNGAVGDVDGDGRPEIITAPGPGPNNQAVISIWKQDGQRLVEVSTFTAFVGGYGVNITTGDIDGDGKVEIIAGTGPDPKNAAVVRAYKSDGTVVLELMPYSSSYGYGVTVAAADIDGDGIDEIITGLGSGPQNPSWVKVFKADGSKLTSFIAYPENVKYGVKVYNGRVGK